MLAAACLRTAPQWGMPPAQADLIARRTWRCEAGGAETARAHSQAPRLACRSAPSSHGRSALVSVPAAATSRRRAVLAEVGGRLAQGPRGRLSRLPTSAAVRAAVFVDECRG